MEVLARHRLAAIRDCRLEVDHRDVGAGEHGCDRREHCLGIGAELVGQHWTGGDGARLVVLLVGEHHVAGERERDRPAAPPRSSRR